MTNPADPPTATWRDIAQDSLTLAAMMSKNDAGRAELAILTERRDVLLAAEEHLPTFHVIASSQDRRRTIATGRRIEKYKVWVKVHQWHVQARGRNGEPLWSTELFNDKSYAIKVAHDWADPMNARVVVDDETEA